MSKVYIYKMTSDDGGAPCVWDDTLSLAICKPAIRSSADKGSIILGFAANSLYADNTLVYAAKVTSRVEGGRYFILPRFRGRPDRIYERVNERFEWHPGAKFHSPRDLTHDLGLAPAYKRANVLVSMGSDNFRYFRGQCSLNYKARFPALKQLIEGLGQGHRVNVSDALRSEIDELVDEVFRMKSIHKRTPVPKVSCGDSCTRGNDVFQIVQC